MTEINSLFEQAKVAAKSLPSRPDDRTMLELYALFKQATEGDVSGDKPGMFDFVAAAKYEAWGRARGLSQEDAMNRYVDLVRKLGGQFGD